MLRRVASRLGRPRIWTMVALLGGLVLATYGPAVRGGLLWDDAAHMTRPDLQSWKGLARIWTEPAATQQYYPILFSAFWVEHRLWGDRTAGYHVLNVVLHTGASLLLVLALRQLWAAGRRRGDGVPEGAEWLAGAIFAVHPVSVESVAWISEQKNTLSLVFYLLAGLVYLQFDRDRKGSRYALALALFLLAIATKTVTATLPAALLVVLWWQRGTLSWRKDFRPLAPWLLLGMAAGVVTALVERNVLGARGSAYQLAMGERALLAGRVIWFYLGKLAWPADLMFIYPHWDVAASAARWVGWLAAALGVTAGLWCRRRRGRGPLAGWLFFTGSLFPALGFINVYPFRYSYVADHFQYLPSLGAIALAAAGGATALERAGTWSRVPGRALSVMLVIALAMLAHEQARTYRDAVTLYRVTLARNPACWMAHNNLGEELAKSPAGVPEAIAHFREALTINPECAEAHYNLALELAKLPGGTPEAVAHYEAALKIRPDYAEAHNNLASLLVSTQGRQAEALAHYEAALRLQPDNAAAHNNLAELLATFPGRVPEAIAHLETALRLRPDSVDAQLNLASLLATIPGREAEAAAHYEAALRLQPDNAGAHNNLAGLLAGLPGRAPEAIAQFEAALRLQPEFADAQLNLANLLAATPGRQSEALTHYAAALTLRPDDAEAHFDLANLLARLPGREADAELQYRTALRLRPNLVEGHNNLGILYAREGRLGEARRQWERALELAPDFEDARRNLQRLPKAQGGAE